MRVTRTLHSNLQELHAMKKHFFIEEEGDPDLSFDAAALGQEEEAQKVTLQVVIDAEFSRQNDGRKSKLIAVLSGAVDVDDDNEATPENALTPESASPWCFQVSGATVDLVFASRRTSQTVMPNFAAQLIPQEMTSICNCLSSSSPSSMLKR